MLNRILALAVIAVLLTLAILYSQYRPANNKVSGFLEADDIRVGSRIGGRVAAVRVQEGERVKQGQVLVELEPFDLLDRQRQAEATLAARQAELERLENGYRPEEIAQAKAAYEQLIAEQNKLKEGPRDQEIEVARARLTVAQAELALAQQNHVRIQNLVEKRAASAEDLDRAGERLAAATATVSLREQELDLLLVGTRQEDLDRAGAQVDEARAAWDLVKNGFRSEEIAAARASRDAAQFALDAMKTQLAELSVKSPVDGVVEALDLQAGDLVPPSAPIMSLLDDRRVWVRTYVPQERRNIRVGQKLAVAIDGLPDGEREGTVSFIARQAEFTPSNIQTPEERSKLVFRIKVTLDNADHSLWPGMTADVSLPPVEDGRD